MFCSLSSFVCLNIKLHVTYACSEKSCEKSVLSISMVFVLSASDYTLQLLSTVSLGKKSIIYNPDLSNQ